MATANQNLSEYDPSTVPSGKGYKVGIVVAEWNKDITFALMQGAIDVLKKHEVNADDIIVEFVPGSFELVAGARLLADTGKFDAVITLGCVIQGDTPHFDYVCQGVTQGIADLNVQYKMPFIFGVLTTDNLQQAKDRAGGIHGNKGDEGAITALKMIELHKRLG